MFSHAYLHPTYYTTAVTQTLRMENHIHSVSLLLTCFGDYISLDSRFYYYSVASYQFPRNKQFGCYNRSR